MSQRNPTRNKVVLIATLVFALSQSSALSQSTPKDHFKEGENLQKQGKLYEAFEEYQVAATAEPNNKKYQSRLREVGAIASSSAQSKGMSEMSASPIEALNWFQRALKYDSSNASAAQMVATVNKNVLSASETCKKAKLALDNGDLRGAKELFASVEIYREAVREIAELKKELSAADSAVYAEEYWGKGDADSALRELKWAESSAPESTFVRRYSEKLREKIADTLIVKVSETQSSTPQQLIEKLSISKAALDVYPKHAKAKQLEVELSTRLAKAIYDQNKLVLLKDTADTERIALERIKIGTPWVQSTSTLDEQRKSAERLAYPRIKLRLVISDAESCKNTVAADALKKMISEAVTPVAVLDNQTWDLTLNIKGLGCSATDAPKQSIESTNSTYVAGHNQLANPRYADLQQQLESAQAELNRAVYQNSVNPNFGTGFAVGFWRGKVNQLQKAMRETAPFITQPIIQQYTYEKFQSYRAYQMAAHLQLSGKSADRQYLTRAQISELSEDRANGTSGVLPTDNTGARNMEPSMTVMDAYVKQTREKFESKLRIKVKELLAGYFATTAMDAKYPGLNRLSAMLYVTDLADGTQYEQEKQKLNSFLSSSLLSGQEIDGNNLSSITLTVPEQVASSEESDDTSNSPESMLERTMDGVLSIETDTGNEGSGFFLTTGCLVVTNKHVVDGAETIILKTASRKLFTAQVLSKDDGRDLALLRSNARVCSPLTLDDSTSTAIGQEVYAIGNPLGLSGTVTRGIISALRKDNNGVQYIQLDASVNPGNSGGPLLSRRGKVLGVNTFKVRGFEGLNFAVASSEIQNAFAQFLR